MSEQNLNILSSPLLEETEITGSDSIIKSLAPYIDKIINLIRDSYHSIVSIKQEIVEDPEIPNYRKICFEINLLGKSDKILEDEEKFYDLFFKIIPEEQQQFFTFTYSIS